MNTAADSAPISDLPRPPSARGRALILITFVLLYGVACWLPAVHLAGRREVWAGVEVMVMGPWGMRFGQLGWFANLTALIALRCVMTGRTLATIVLTTASIILGLQALWLPGRVIPLGPEEFNEVRVISLSSGYYVWMAALIVPLLAALLLRQARPRAHSIDL